MQRITVILAAVLAVQIAVALALTVSSPDYAAFKAEEPLLAFAGAKVDRIAIAEGEGSSVTLRKQDEGWVIAEFADFPAETGKVTAFLDRLAGLKKGWPVATTAGAADRFKVSESTHERRITLYDGDEAMGTVLLGTSPAFRHVHARAGNDEAVYSVAFATYEASGRGEEWVDRGGLATAEDSIASIAFPDFTLERNKDGAFVVAGLAEGQKTAEGAVRGIVRVVTNPPFDAITGKGEEALAKLGEPDLQVALKRKDGTTVRLSYKKEAEGGAYGFASSAHDYVFRVGESAVKAVVTAERGTVIEAPEEKEEKKEKAPQAVTTDGDHDAASGG